MRGETNITSVLMGGVLANKSNKLTVLTKDLGSMTIAAGQIYYQNANANVSQSGYRLIGAMYVISSQATTKAVATAGRKNDNTAVVTIMTLDRNAASAAITDAHWTFYGLYEKI